MSYNDFGKKKIAIVDDDEATRQTLKAYISCEADLEAELFESGNELLEYLQRDYVDVIVLDIEMEGLDGLETYDRLKKSSSSEIPVMFLTGISERETVLKCIHKGADGFMLKPVSREAFISKIEGIISKYDEFKSNKTILMIDDDARFLKLAKAKLSKYYKVLTEESGKAGIEYLAGHDVDLIILDYFMPLFDGGKVLAILKHREKTKNIPVIMLSSLPEEEVRSVCKDNPPEGVAIKNGHLEELLVMINRLLEK